MLSLIMLNVVVPTNLFCLFLVGSPEYLKCKNLIWYKQQLTDLIASEGVKGQQDIYHNDTQQNN
jgi:hypothetical protein